MNNTPYAGMTDEEILKWYLLDRKLDVEESVEKLVKMHAWRQAIRYVLQLNFNRQLLRVLMIQ